MPWKKLIYFGSALLVGVMLGVSSFAAFLISAQFTTDGVGPWRYGTHLGTQASSPKWKAIIAIIGFLALPKEESMYFNAMQDDDGDLLRCDCTYRIETPALSCRWWSVTMYDKLGYLMDNPEDRYSYNMDQLTPDKNGMYVFHVSPEKQEGPWVPTGEDTFFDLTLRIYNPSEEFMRALNDGSLNLPRIIKEGCPDA